ncbi:probable F-box protein At1g65740 [Solanum verrucosum]|uniref:probable F-box protein At1g65740 n=1 Tax=Solanum verrucosum TaxID=315347 RepID=UPI0020CFEB24|nr:probable F-box protein At1g65740 [Solanum verrucosum]
MVVACPVPLLMLAEKPGKEESREFFDLIKGVTYTMNFPELVGKRCLGVGIPGWIFTADLKGNMNLFHLNSRCLIELPHMNTLENFDLDYHIEFEYYVEKALLSSHPHTNDDYILMINQGVPRSLAYWKSGNMGFITVTHEGAYSDVTYHDEQFYGVDFQGNVVIFDFRGRGLERPIKRIVEGVPSEFIYGMQLYIVHSLGELFVITRNGVEKHPETNLYGVEEFIVARVDVDNESYEEVDDLGNRAIFLGFSASTAVVEQYGCKANHIYFTDDCSTAYYFSENGGGKDMGIYNLLDDTIEPHYTGESYHKFSPPIWIFNTPFSV